MTSYRYVPDDPPAEAGAGRSDAERELARLRAVVEEVLAGLHGRVDASAAVVLSHALEGR